MTDDEIREYASALILEHARDVEYLTIFEMSEEYGPTGVEPSDDEAKRIYALIVSADVTVGWAGEVVTGIDIPDEAYEAARQASKADATRGAGVFYVLPTIVQASAPIIVAGDRRALASQIEEMRAHPDVTVPNPQWVAGWNAGVHAASMWVRRECGVLDPDGETR